MTRLRSRSHALRPRWVTTAAAGVLAALALGLGLAVGLASAGVAWAHPALVQSAPAAGVVVETPPAAVAVSLSEEVVARGAGLSLSGPRGPVALGPVRRSGTASLRAEVRARLAPGVYRLRW